MPNNLHGIILITGAIVAQNDPAAGQTTVTRARAFAANRDTIRHGSALYYTHPMKYNPEYHHRRSIRLPGYNYTRPGAYFVTLCVQDRACLFGDVENGRMQLNDAGRIAEKCWREIPVHFPHVRLDAFIIMPNHVHGVLIIVGDVRPCVGANNYSPLRRKPPQPENTPRQTESPPFTHGTSKTIGSIVRGFKIGVIKRSRTDMGVFVAWQRNYYEHIIRDNESMDCIKRYIDHNPAQWASDRENPAFHPRRSAFVGANNYSPLRRNSPQPENTPQRTPASGYLKF